MKFQRTLVEPKIVGVPKNRIDYLEEQGIHFKVTFTFNVTTMERTMTGDAVKLAAVAMDMDMGLVACSPAF
jgi:hypothetical protein